MVRFDGGHNTAAAWGVQLLGFVGWFAVLRVVLVFLVFLF